VTYVDALYGILAASFALAIFVALMPDDGVDE